MGWSCATDANETMKKWTAACVAQTGSQNVYVVKGQKYMWEISETEHADGAITGTIFKMLTVKPDGSGTVRQTGSFRIEPDGSVGRAPAFLKAAK